MNQLTIKPGSFFICGPIKGDVSEVQEKNHYVEKTLNSLGCNTVNQFIICNAKGLNIHNLKYTIPHLINCNTLVTLQNWTECEFAKKQVEIAQLLGLDIIDYTKLVSHLNEKGT